MHIEVLNRRGSPENPLSLADIEFKFRNVAGGCASDATLDRIVEACAGLERLDDVLPLAEWLAAPNHTSDSRRPATGISR